MAQRGRPRRRKRHVSGSGDTPGRGRFPSLGQRLPALCAGCLVRAGGEAAAKGRAFLIRYADDFVIGFAREEDARRVLDVLPKRFGKYGLSLHPDKTRLVPFRPPSDRPLHGSAVAGRKPGSFDLLGFTHHWGRSRKGPWVVK